MDNIDVLVVDEAEEGLDPEGEGLLGLYEGMPLPETGVEYAGELPDVIYIFRRSGADRRLARRLLRLWPSEES